MNELIIGKPHCKNDVDKNDKNSGNNSTIVIKVLIIVIAMIIEIWSFDIISQYQNITSDTATMTPKWYSDHSYP